MEDNPQNTILPVDADAASNENPSLLEMMDRLSNSASQNGLTEEKLKELLADD